MPGHAECPHRAIGQVGFAQEGIALAGGQIFAAPSAVCSCMPVCGAGEGPRCGASGCRPWKRGELAWSAFQLGCVSPRRPCPHLFWRVPAAGWASSHGTVLVAAAALGAENVGQGIDRRTWIGVRVEPAASFGADAASLADQERAAEQVGPDLHPVVAPLRFAARIWAPGRQRRERHSAQDLGGFPCR
jgi:hypothetical protein